MAITNNKKQKLIIQDIISSPDIYIKTSGILKPSYFDIGYEPVVKYIHDYYEKYSDTPAIDQLNAEFDIDIEVTDKLNRARIQSTCDNIERFCREVAVNNAIYESLEDVSNDKMGPVLDRIEKAVQICLMRDLGIDVFEDPEGRLQSLVEMYTPIPTLIDGIDIPLEGGLVRTQLTLVSANSGGGKSLLLANLGRNYAAQGKDVLYISLELDEGLVFLRLASMISGLDTETWKSNIPEMAERILNSEGEEGSYMLKWMPECSTALDIRSYLSYYEMEYNRTPDVLIVDYLDIMDPNCGVVNISISEQDKRKSQEVRGILKEYNMIGISASQQTRDAINITTPDQSVIAGGISKVNTADNYISLYMDDTMELMGEMMLYFLKTRSAKGKGKSTLLDFNTSNLRLTDPKSGSQLSVMPNKRRKKKDEGKPNNKSDNKPPAQVTAKIDQIPGIEIEEKPLGEKPLPNELFEEEKLPVMPGEIITIQNAEIIMSLMTGMKGA